MVEQQVKLLLGYSQSHIRDLVCVLATLHFQTSILLTCLGDSKR